MEASDNRWKIVMSV